jgi:DNA-binding PadR family transcriptional regulator
MLEIGTDRIDTASSFVNYISEEYGFSKSSIWYNLNRLREMGLVEFANKEEIGKPLNLTKAGRDQLGGFERSRSELVSYFNRVLMQKVSPFGGVGSGYVGGVYR